MEIDSQPSTSSAADAEPLSQAIHLLRVGSTQQLREQARAAAPSTAPPKGNKRGRKPDLATRTERELLRKTNHSIIEKRRRTKINEALATLRELVPSDISDEDGGSDTGEAGKKEFKLEVLVRTVAYLKKLIDKVERLEDELAMHKSTQKRTWAAADRESGAAGHQPTPRRRNRVSNEHIPATSYDNESTAGGSSTSGSPFLPASNSSPQFRLPPIASLFLPESQLPSPPSSIQTAPMTHLSAPPSFALPMPLARRDSSTSREGSCAGDPSRRRSWSREDEAMASMLLDISASESSHPDRKHSSRPAKSHSSRVHTPAYLLGFQSPEENRAPS